MAGVARENASRILSEWERKNQIIGLLSIDGAKLKGEINE